MTIRVFFRVCVLFSLCCFSIQVFGANESDQFENVSTSPTRNSNPNQDSKCSVKCQDFEALATKNGEQGKVIDEMKEQFTTFQSAQETCNGQLNVLSKKFEELESRISEDHGVWMLRPPLRGPPGKQGDKGETGRNGEAGQNGRQGERGLVGPKGERGQVGPEGRAGQDGRSGVKGDPGTKGATEERGVKGEKGDSILPDPKSIKSCSDAMEKSPFNPRRKQSIYPYQNSKTVQVLCDFETDGGGWTIIQKRSNGPKYEFNQNWADYANGFGSLDKNFWLGLEKIHTLTKKGDQELRIELEDFEGNKRYAKYSSFSISDASDFYRLSISGFSGDAGDSMNYINGRRFSTKDNDNDDYSGNCVEHQGGGGGWWFKSCSFSVLNGRFLEKGETTSWNGIIWNEWKGSSYSLAKTEMKIRTRK